MHHNTKLYKDKKTNKYTKRNKTSYHSSGKKYYYVSFSYKKGKTTSRSEYRYNKVEQTKSNKHGKAYRYKTSFKKGKAKKTIRQQYNKKGKLLKAKKVAKRNFL